MQTGGSLRPGRLARAGSSIAMGFLLVALPMGVGAQGIGGGLDLGVGVTFGTLGFGGQVSKLLFSHLGVRAGLNYFSFSPNETFNDVQYDAKLRLESIPLLVDLYPMARGALHVTGGMVINRTQLTGTAIPGPTGTITINHDSYTSAQVGVLNGSFKYPSSGGYFGIGFGTPARKSFMAASFDIGAILSRAQVALTATGAATDAKLATDLAAQQVSTQSTVNKLSIYPVISSGVTLRF